MTTSVAIIQSCLDNHIVRSSWEYFPRPLVHDLVEAFLTYYPLLENPSPVKAIEIFEPLLARLAIPLPRANAKLSMKCMKSNGYCKYLWKF